MTIGDKIRNMSDEELAEMFEITIAANGGDPDEAMVVDLGGDNRILAFDADDLAEELGKDATEDE
jgi:hypothetical protein